MTFNFRHNHKNRRENVQENFQCQTRKKTLKERLYHSPAIHTNNNLPNEAVAQYININKAIKQDTCGAFLGLSAPQQIFKFALTNLRSNGGRTEHQGILEEQIVHLYLMPTTFSLFRRLKLDDIIIVTYPGWAQNLEVYIIDSDFHI